MVKSHIKLWLIGFFLMIFVVPAILPPTVARQRIETEFNASAEIFGVDRVSAIVERANRVFETIVGGMGLDRVIASGYVRERDVENTIGEGANKAGSSFTNSYLQSMMLLIYGVFFRGSLMLQWMAYVGVFLVAAVVDGVAQRQIKAELMRMNAPVAFSITFHAVIAIAFAPVAYLLLPFAVTPWFMPAWTILMALPLSKAIANAVKTG